MNARVMAGRVGQAGGVSLYLPHQPDLPHPPL